MTGFGKDLTEIAALLIGVGLVGLLVTNSQGASADIMALGKSFGGVLSIATFQNKYGNPFATGL